MLSSRGSGDSCDTTAVAAPARRRPATTPIIGFARPTSVVSRPGAASSPRMKPPRSISTGRGLTSAPRGEGRMSDVVDAGLAAADEARVRGRRWGIRHWYEDVINLEALRPRMLMVEGFGMWRLLGVEAPAAAVAAYRARMAVAYRE